ncbi:CRISPR-associated endonuclease Cas6 [Gimesia panareensis]|uniref:CRISPR-associated endonuclease Cas6 n=1 Tax=Gimesia panareensis TaxID=2527978 RepID=A0A517Q7W3_9PLAN|nr:type I-MYXAN CRISPR-associated protein Cas6/Cmx6 [Gimesia panareensis]QDT27681.1 CRISPR-associated endonuclease Cas6 [Gimesia panareensis]
MYVDLNFRLTAQDPVPVDHGYPLYAALSRLLPVLHQQNGIGIHPLQGQYLGDGQVALRSDSCLVFRTHVEQVNELLNLTGKSIQLRRSTILIGVPQLKALVAEPILRSRLVVIKVKGRNAAQLDEKSFQTAVKKQLSACEVSSRSLVEIRRRRTLRIKEKTIVGYEVVLENLAEEESLQIQIQGIGGRRHMGCGLFKGYRTSENSTEISGSAGHE